MLRYVILYHACPPDYGRASHWDLMLEKEGHLRTWALSAEPGRDRVVEAQGLPPHRLSYLDYEGPLSGGRGSVSCWDHGLYRIRSETAAQLVLELQGARLQGTFSLRQESEATGATATNWRWASIPSTTSQSHGGEPDPPADPGQPAG